MSSSVRGKKNKIWLLLLFWPNKEHFVRVLHSSLIIIFFSQVNFHLLPRVSETKSSQYELNSSESHIKYSNTDSYGLNGTYILNTPISLLKIIFFPVRFGFVISQITGPAAVKFYCLCLQVILTKWSGPGTFN